MPWNTYKNLFPGLCTFLKLSTKKSLFAQKQILLYALFQLSEWLLITYKVLVFSNHHLTRYNLKKSSGCLANFTSLFAILLNFGFSTFFFLLHLIAFLCFPDVLTSSRSWCCTSWKFEFEFWFDKLVNTVVKLIYRKYPISWKLCSNQVLLHISIQY